MRQFSAVNLPVPQSGTGVIAGEPAAKPAVIQHEKLYPQVCRTFHHAVQHFSVKVKYTPSQEFSKVGLSDSPPRRP